MSTFENFLLNASSESHLRIESDLGDGFVRLREEEADRRQAAQDIRCSEDIVIEMLRNSRDAHARNVFLATTVSGPIRTICVLDDGDGIPERLHEIMFEPRVTSKLDSAHKDCWGYHGRGMALYSIRQNTLESIVQCSSPGLGTSILVKTDLTQLPEKSDQSTFPKFKIEKDHSVSIRGPKNILRTACEFALEERNSIKVYIGSPAEISAAILERACANVPFNLRAFTDGMGSTLIINKPAFCPDPESLSECLNNMGLAISRRTAQRVFKGDVRPPCNLIQRIAEEGFASAKRKPESKKPRHSLSSASASLDLCDKEFLSDALRSPLNQVLDKYYLRMTDTFDCKIQQGTLRITVPVLPKD